MSSQSASGLVLDFTTTKSSEPCAKCKQLESGADMISFWHRKKEKTLFLCMRCGPGLIATHPSAKVHGEKVQSNTVLRFTEQSSTTVEPSENDQVEQREIWENLNAARKKDPSGPKKVMSVGMRQPTGVSHQRVSTPVVMSSQSAGLYYPAHQARPIEGYTPNHASYADHLQKNRMKVYASKPGESVNILLVFGYMDSKTNKFKDISNDLTEGGIVTPSITSKELKQKWDQDVLVKIERKYLGFTFDWTKSCFREVDRVLNLEKDLESEPLRVFCFILGTSKKGKAKVNAPNNELVFKKPTKPFRIGVVLEESEKERFMEWLAAEEEKREDAARPGEMKPVSGGDDKDDLQFMQSLSSVSISPVRQPKNVPPKRKRSLPSPRAVSESLVHSPHQSPPRKRSTTESAAARAQVPQSTDTDDGQSTEPFPSAPSEGLSLSSGLLLRAMRSGGTVGAGTGKVWEDIRLYPVPSRVRLDTMLNEVELRQFNRTGRSYMAIVDIDMKQKLGIGAQKDCYAAALTVTSLSDPQSDPDIPGPAVAVKRLFLRSTGISFATKITHRYGSFEKEQEQTFNEGNVLYWCNGLLSWTLAWARSEAQSQGLKVTIPALRFVKAGVAVVKDQKAYIVEERLSGSWRKYISNGMARPMEDLSAEEAALAEFLCFLQHVQWWKTTGMAFVSDYQGVGVTLSDPQLMTTPKLGEKLFGDGNVGMLSEKFRNVEPGEIVSLLAGSAPATQLAREYGVLGDGQ